MPIATIPPTTVVPIECRALAPGPSVSFSGNTPNMKVT
jgi:hypothetical protein